MATDLTGATFLRPPRCPGGGDGAVIARGHERGTVAVELLRSSWCVPCRREMPALLAVAGRRPPRAAFVGIDHQDGRSPAADFERQVGVRYPSGYGPDGRMTPTCGAAGSPTAALIDGRGRLVARHLGDLTEDVIVDLVRQAFGIDASASR